MLISKHTNGIQHRRGAVMVEFAVCLPLMVLLMLGTWDVGRMVQIQLVMENAAREGARTAASGRINDTDVTTSMVYDSVDRYLQNVLDRDNIAGLQVDVENLSSNSWTNPSDAENLDQFRVRVTVPRATFSWLGFNYFVPDQTNLVATSVWRSMKDKPIEIDTSIPSDDD